MQKLVHEIKTLQWDVIKRYWKMVETVNETLRGVGEKFNEWKKEGPTWETEGPEFKWSMSLGVEGPLAGIPYIDDSVSTHPAER